MNVDQKIWQYWARILQRLGLQDWTATVLEAIGPLGVFGAQIVYLVEPPFKLLLPHISLRPLARLLEEPTQIQAFAELLREGDIQ